MKQASDIHVAAAVVSNRKRGFEQGAVCELAEEADRIKKVRFPDAVSSRYASEGSKLDIHSYEVLESIDF